MFRCKTIHKGIRLNPDKFAKLNTPAYLRSNFAQSMYPQQKEYFNLRSLSTTPHNYDFRSRIKELLFSTLNSNKEISSGSAQANESLYQTPSNQRQPSPVNQLKNMWRDKEKRTTSNYVGLMVAVDARHTEKIWKSFWFDPQSSVSEMAVNNKTRELWARFIEKPNILGSLTTTQVQSLRDVMQRREDVIFKILNLFTEQIQAENSFRMAGNGMRGARNKNLASTENYWGYRFIAVLSHLFFMREWCELAGLKIEDSARLTEDVDASFYENSFTQSDYNTLLSLIHNYQIHNGYSGNSYSLQYYLNREEPLSTEVAQDESPQSTTNSDGSNLVKLDKAMEISLATQSPMRVYLQTLKMMAKNFDISTKELNNALTLCLVSGDLNATIDVLKSFSLLKIDGLVEMSTLYGPPATEPKEVDYSVFNVFENDTHAARGSEIPKKSQIIERYFKKLTPIKNIELNPLSFALIGQIITEYNPTSVHGSYAYKNLNQLNQHKSTLMRNIYTQFKTLLDGNEDFQAKSGLPTLAAGISPEAHHQLLPSSGNYIIPIVSVLTQLLAAFVKSDDVTEALNVYESLKLAFKNLSPKAKDATAGEQEANHSNVSEIYKAANVKHFEYTMKLAKEFSLDWWAKIIILDLKEYNLIPSVSLINSYVKALTSGKDSLFFTELESSVEELYSYYATGATLSESAQLLTDILVSLSSQSSLESTVQGLKEKDTEKSYESIGYNLFTKYFEKSQVTPESYEQVVKALVDCMCAHNNINWVEKAQTFVSSELENNQELQQDLVLAVMEALSRTAFPNRALNLFESFLEESSSKDADFGVQLDLYASAMKAYYIAKDYNQVIDIARVILPDQDSEKGSKQSKTRGKSGIIDSGSAGFSDITLRDIPEFVFDILTYSYVKRGLMDESLRLLEKLRAEKIQSTSFMYSCLVSGFGTIKKPEGIYLVAALANLDRNLSPRNVEFLGVASKPSIPDENVKPSANNKQSVNLGADYYTALIEAYANCSLTTLAFQNWELMQMIDIAPTERTAKVMIDLCGWTEFRDFVKEPTLLKHDSFTFNSFSRDLFDREVNRDNARIGKMYNLYKLGSVLQSLKKSGYVLSKSDVKSVFEVLCRARLYEDAVNYLLANELYTTEAKTLKPSNADGEVGNDPIFYFAKNLLSLVGTPAAGALKKLEQSV